MSFLARSGSTVAEIDLSALVHNLEEIRSAAGKQVGVLAAVKADAYGHGACEVSRALEKAGVNMLGVARIEEGVELRDAGIGTPILVLSGVPVGGPPPFETLEQRLDELLHFRLTPVLYDIGTALALDRLLQKRAMARELDESGPAPRLEYHLKLDTGMGRIGLPINSLSDALEALVRLKHLQMVGALTHFADADDEEELGAAEFTRAQAERFKAAMGTLRANAEGPMVFHAANSAASMRKVGVELDLIRPGIALYGIQPSPKMKTRADLQPVMRLTTRVLYVKSLPAGSPVSYNRTFTTTRDTRVATLPVGYGDGYPRSLSNRGQVLVRGKRAPVIGRVCMDLTLVDVTEIPGVAAGDEAVLIGNDGADRMSAEEIAGKAGTIPYEIVCQVSKRVPRIYKGSA